MVNVHSMILYPKVHARGQARGQYMSLKLGMQRRGYKLYKVYIDDNLFYGKVKFGGLCV